MARRLDGSTGGESLAARGCGLFLSIHPVRARKQKAAAAKLRAFARADIGNAGGAKSKLCGFCGRFCALFRRFGRVKNGGGGVRLIFMAEGEGKSARMGKAFRLRVKRMRKGGKYGISY